MAEVGAQAKALAELVTWCGGQVLADVSPGGGGRHLYVLFAAASKSCLTGSHGTEVPLLEDRRDLGR